MTVFEAPLGVPQVMRSLTDSPVPLKLEKAILPCSSRKSGAKTETAMAASPLISNSLLCFPEAQAALPMLLKCLAMCSHSLRVLELSGLQYCLFDADVVLPSFPKLLSLKLFDEGYPGRSKASPPLDCPSLHSLDLCSGFPQPVSFASKYTTLRSLQYFSETKTGQDDLPLLSLEGFLPHLRRLCLNIFNVEPFREAFLQLVSSTSSRTAVKTNLASIKAAVPAQIGLNIRFFRSSPREEHNLLSAASLSRHDFTPASFLVEEALALGMSPAHAAEYCLQSSVWDCLDNCMAAGLKVTERVQESDNIFVSLCHQRTPLPVLQRFWNAHVEPNLISGTVSGEDLLVTGNNRWGSGYDVLSIGATGFLPPETFEWLMSVVGRYGLTPNLENAYGHTALHLIVQRDSVFRAAFGTQPALKARILIEKGGAQLNPAILSQASGAVLFEILQLLQEGVIPVASFLTDPPEVPLLHRIFVCDIEAVGPYQQMVWPGQGGEEGIEQVSNDPISTALRLILKAAREARGDEFASKMILQCSAKEGVGLLEKAFHAIFNSSASDWDSRFAARTKAILECVPSPAVALELVSAVGNRGYDPENRFLRNMPALHYASVLSFPITMQLLLETGADPKTPCDWNLPLSLAVQALHQRALHCVRLLLQFGADPAGKCRAVEEEYPLHWLLKYLAARGPMYPVEESEDDEILGNSAGKRRKHVQRRKNQVISVDSDYDSDSVAEEKVPFEADDLDRSVTNLGADFENDEMEWAFESEAVQIARLLIIRGPTEVVNSPLAGIPDKCPLSYIGEISDKGDSSAALLLFQAMLRRGLSLSLPRHKEILQGWRNKRSRLPLLSAISDSRKQLKRASQKRPVPSSRRSSLFREDESDDDGFQHWY